MAEDAADVAKFADFTGEAAGAKAASPEKISGPARAVTERCGPLPSSANLRSLLSRPPHSSSVPPPLSRPPQPGLPVH